MRGTDIPEPLWWKGARRLRESGMTLEAIGERYGKHHASVRYALCTEYREKQQKRSREQYFIHRQSGSHSDYKRHTARKEARARWRNEQYSKPLGYYYKQLECL